MAHFPLCGKRLGWNWVAQLVRSAVQIPYKQQGHLSASIPEICLAHRSQRSVDGRMGLQLSTSGRNVQNTATAAVPRGPLSVDVRFMIAQTFHSAKMFSITAQAGIAGQFRLQFRVLSQYPFRCRLPSSTAFQGQILFR